MRVPVTAPLLLALALAGCTAADGDGSHEDPAELAATTYAMHVEGMPTAPVAPGSTFNVTVRGTMGSGMGMHRMTTDHVGAHFWNMSVMDPTGKLADAKACSHTGGEMPMEAKAMCTAPW